MKYLNVHINIRVAEFVEVAIAIDIQEKIGRYIWIQKYFFDSIVMHYCVI